jgi:signal peptidase II
VHARACAHMSLPTLATSTDQRVKYRLGFSVALVVFALDQLAKWIVTGPLGVNQVGDQLYLLPFFQFSYVRNPGISLGLLNATNPFGRWMLVGLTTAIAVGVAIWIGREKNRVEQAALGMVLGGALGNILDRTLHSYVVDFADLHFRGVPHYFCLSYENGLCRPFLVFNVGDAAISIGVVILLLRTLLARKDHDEGHEPKETIEHA